MVIEGLHLLPFIEIEEGEEVNLAIEGEVVEVKGDIQEEMDHMAWDMEITVVMGGMAESTVDMAETTVVMEDMESTGDMGMEETCLPVQLVDTL